jgi:hypothetical protein
MTDKQSCNVGVFAAGLVLVFLSLLNYLIDSYVVFAASVLAANSVMRSLFGAAFPLFTTYMYQNLGIHWASSIPAFLALVCMPFPYLFYRYGHAIRMKCAFAAEAAAVLERMRASHQVIDEDEAEAEVEAAEKHDRELHKLSRNRSRPDTGLAVGDNGHAQGVLSDDERTMAGATSEDETIREKEVS